MLEKTKDFAVGTTKVVAKVTVPGVAGVLAGMEKYDECKSNGDGSVMTTAKVTGTAIYEQAKCSIGGALLVTSLSG